MANIDTPIWSIEGVALESVDPAVANSLAARVIAIQSAIGGEEGNSHLPLFTGDIHYVDAAQADDTGDGTSPETAKKTIVAGIGLLSAGDRLVVKAGTYDESGMDLNVQASELCFEAGTILQDSGDGTVLTISAFGCKVTGSGNVRVDPTGGATGVLVSGSFVWLEQIRIFCNDVGALGIDITGGGAALHTCRCAGPTTAAFKVQGEKAWLNYCCTGGTEDAGTIGFWITNSCDKARLNDCGSQGHSTAGFQIDAGCTNVVARNCDSGGGDGHFIDNGTRTFLDIRDRDSREMHEHVHPTPDGEGAAGDTVAIQSQVNDETGADDTANYFGDCALLVDVGDFAFDWFWIGTNIFATTAADDQRYRGYRIVSDFSATRNGGNAWDAGATVLTVQDATEAAQFEVNDLVWIASPGYKPAGEIVKVTDVTGAVITIARQTENSGRTGLHWNHTTNDAGNEVMYLCWRDERRYHSTDWDYSASGARDFTRALFSVARRMHANDGLVARMINGTDTANSQASLTIVWGD